MSVWLFHLANMEKSTGGSDTILNGFNLYHSLWNKQQKKAGVYFYDLSWRHLFKLSRNLNINNIETSTASEGKVIHDHMQDYVSLFYSGLN